jgi:hypothetical protein
MASLVLILLLALILIVLLLLLVGNTSQLLLGILLIEHLLLVIGIHWITIKLRIHLWRGIHHWVRMHALSRHLLGCNLLLLQLQIEVMH